jgi:hypothetical protein
MQRGKWKMRPVGTRKDHRFDSDGQIKACRGRETNEEQDLIREQLDELQEDVSKEITEK